uniref:Ankyrin repeat and SOCS box containing 5 n=1 Tax=Junco hyemalis TaxID=40217 RepID=A0A8C5J4Y8_JUNHY
TPRSCNPCLPTAAGSSCPHSAPLPGPRRPGRSPSAAPAPARPRRRGAPPLARPERRRPSPSAARAAGRPCRPQRPLTRPGPALSCRALHSPAGSACRPARPGPALPRHSLPSLSAPYSQRDPGDGDADGHAALLEGGGDEAAEGSWADRSPLHEAASQGRLLSLKTLLSQGYNVDTLTIDQVTPLHEACLGDHVGCARILLEAGANVNATTIDGVTPLFNACSRGSAACAELLLQYGAKAQWESCLPSPTHEAASRGHSECLEVLISWGIDVDQDLPHLGTPLYVACVSQQIHCIRKLLYAGANVQKGKHLQTPLHAAAQHSSTEIVNLLLEFGADINAKNSDFERPVDLAAPSSLVERLLLFHEATPSSLCQLCRLCIRNYIGRARLHLVPQLQLPTILKNFLQYR